MNDYRRNRLITISKELMPEMRTGRSFHVSFILKNNKLLAFAPNDYTQGHLTHIFGEYKPTRSELGNYTPSRHSEVTTLRLFYNKFGHLDMAGLTLFNVRIGFNYEVMPSKPCGNCEKVLDGLNFKSIDWT
jgi:hypothetical protein